MVAMMSTPQGKHAMSPDTSTSFSTMSPQTISSQEDMATPSNFSCTPSISCTPSACRTPRSCRVGGASEGGGVHVRVAARVRPLLPAETMGPNKARDCIEASSQALSIGKNCYVFDHVFPSSSSQEDVYTECVEPLVEATLEGVNGTLLAYGQTGSGKTYTMGTGGSSQDAPEGALQKAMEAIFARVQERDVEGASNTSFRVSYVEIFTDVTRGNAEEIRDLLHMGHGSGSVTLKPDVDGQVKLDGVLEQEVWSAHEALTLLSFGSTRRATCSTRMNDSSSRSHALFALEVVQRKLVGGEATTLTAKFQFADLAGSEKVKLSGVEGEQLSQAININHGLFVLGRVITALTEGQPHVPFRESKLTRILRNSLGGNSRTCMIACVSPSDANIADSISTLTYAAKAKEITNKPVVNRGSSCPNCAELRARLEALEARTEAAVPVQPSAVHFRQECVLEMERESAKLRRENARLQQALDSPSEKSKEEEGRQVAEKADKYEQLFVKCSERLAALQEASRVAELAVETALLARLPDEIPTDVDSFLDASSDGPGSPGSPEGLDLESQDLSWLEQEAGRKQRLMLQVEDNYQAMATLQVQAEERVQQQEARRDILEKELQRLRCELEEARSREEHYAQLQEYYDKKLSALEERNVALERERQEAQRLRTLQKRQETRLRVLQDSVSQVKMERDALKRQLAEEMKKKERGQLRKEKGSLQSSKACLTPWSGRESQKNLGGRWAQLLQTVAERTTRERKLKQEQGKFQAIEARLLALAAQRERAKVEAEVNGTDATNTLVSLQAEVSGLMAAREYQQEQVWMCSKELESCPRQDVSELAIAQAKELAEEDLVSGLSWLCAEAARLQEALQLAQEAQEAKDAETEAIKAKVKDARRQVAQQEQASDLLQSDYESRVASLLTCYKGDGAGLEAALGEDAMTLLARKVSQLEGQLSRERSEAREKGQQRLEKDMELITSFRDKDSECRLLQKQVGEANAKAERAVTRAAQREAQLRERLEQMESSQAAKAVAAPAVAEKAEAKTGADSGLIIPSTDLSWGLELLEDFWRVTGLTDNRAELVESIRVDVEALCKRKLHDHLEWKRELEEKIAAMHIELNNMAEALGEKADYPPEKANLLQTSRMLEQAIGNLAGLKETRASDLRDLLAAIQSLQERLGCKSPWPPLPSLDAPGSLKPQALEEVRKRLGDLERLKSQRSLAVAGHASTLRSLWSYIGLRIPEELDPEEARLLGEGDEVPISISFLEYLTAREPALADMKAQLEQAWQSWQEQLQSWLQLLAPFHLSLPEVPPKLPLRPAVEALKIAVAETERVTEDFLQKEVVSLRDFYKSSLLRSVIEVCNELETTEGLRNKAVALAARWDQINLQRTEHNRVVELIGARENLEVEMRHFDAEVSDPARFKKRGYSGVQENKRRTDFQRHLKMLDSSLAASTNEWAQREGMPFCLGGQEYRGVDLLPSDHTHMYAWTNKQLKQAASPAAATPSTQSRSSLPGSPAAATPSTQSRSSLPGSPAAVPAAGYPSSQSRSSLPATPSSLARSPGRTPVSARPKAALQPESFAEGRRNTDPGRLPSAAKRPSVAGTSPGAPRRSAVEGRQPPSQQPGRRDGRMRA